MPQCSVVFQSKSLFSLLLAIIVITSIKGELQRENKLASYEKAFKMLENDMCITVIGQAILELLNFKAG